jgi:CRP-like cAMP-binding protein
MAQNPQLDQLLLRLLSSVALFDGLDRNDLIAVLSMSRRAEFAPESLLFGEGDDSSSMYVVVSGSVEVFRKPKGAEPVQLSIVGPGGTVGEMALVEHAPRAASVRAIAATVALELSRSALSSRLQIEAALYRNIARMLAQRLRKNNDTLTALAAKAQTPPAKTDGSGKA